jgi:hypothetical protein
MCLTQQKQNNCHAKTTVRRRPSWTTAWASRQDGTEKATLCLDDKLALEASSLKLGQYVFNRFDLTCQAAWIATCKVHRASLGPDELK